MIQSVYHSFVNLASRQVRRRLGTAAEARWLVLIHQIPPKPDYMRVKIGRDLRRLGAVAIKNSVYVLPAAPRLREALAEIVREILQRGGEAAACEARFIEGLSDDAVEDLFREARDGDYAALAEEAKRLAATLRPRAARDVARRHLSALRLERLKRRFEDIVSKDQFGARGRETAAGLLSLAEDRLQGVEVGSKHELDLSKTPHGAIWVTRTGVMVDRIASAWLIRRFIDSAARFKFVAARGHHPGKGELRFDMAGAEFTHEGDHCTFEVLVERFTLRDSALKPIAEIVHDIDLKDSKHGRQEAAGVDRMIVGLAIANASDEARLIQGGAVFDNLYEYFRRERSDR